MGMICGKGGKRERGVMDDGRVDATEEVEITEVEKERKESEAGAYNPPTMGGRSTPHIRQ